MKKPGNKTKKVKVIFPMVEMMLIFQQRCPHFGQNSTNTFSGIRKPG